MQDRLAAIVASSNDPIIGKNLDGIVESWNHAAELLYGYSEAEALGRQIYFVVPPDRLDEMPAILDRIKRGQRIARYETVRITKDGRRLDVFLSVSPVYEEGRIVGAASIVRDNTEHNRLEELSRRYTKRLELIHEMDQKILHHASGRECAEFVVRQLVAIARLPRLTITVIDFDARIAHGMVSFANWELGDGIDYPLDPLITPR
jgi:PAS domain S-box-containing protein